jgi:single-strand DNA-binding protein
MFKAMIIGNLGRDATSNNVSGKNVINFTVAHTESWNNAQGEKQSRTVWADCSYWTDKTGILPYLKKGTQVYVEGQPDARAYIPNGGTEPTATLTIRVAQVQLLGGNKDNSTGGAATGNSGAASTGGGHSVGNANFGGSNNKDDLPF